VVMMNRMYEVLMKLGTRDDKKEAIVKMKYPLNILEHVLLAIKSSFEIFENVS
jgi:hypothetical protein